MALEDIATVKQDKCGAIVTFSLPVSLSPGRCSKIWVLSMPKLREVREKYHAFEMQLDVPIPTVQILEHLNTNKTLE